MSENIRNKQRNERPASERGFHITIGASPVRPTPSTILNLQNDLRMVKAALLYADSATLYSSSAALTLAFQSMSELSGVEQLELLKALTPSLSDKQHSARMSIVLKIFEETTGKRNLSKEEQQLEIQIRLTQARVPFDWAGFKSNQQKIAEESGATEIRRAIDSGILNLHRFGIHNSPDELAREYLETVSHAVTNNSTYPLFDQTTGRHISRFIEAGKIPITQLGLKRSKRPGLATNLLQRLPLFDDASIEELLQIRRGLEPFLKGFRRAIADYADKVQTAPWDSDFVTEADMLFDQVVEPVIEKIEEEIRANDYYKIVGKKLISASVPGSIGVILSLLSVLPLFISGPLSVGPAVLSALISAEQEWKRRSEAVEKNQMYFYYETRNILAYSVRKQ